jgi:hypothetical protein
MGNAFSLHFGQTIRGKIEVLLGTTGGTIWELGEPDDNGLRHIENKRRTQKVAPSPLFKEKNWSSHEGKLGLLIGSMKLLFPKLSVTIFGLG